MLVNTSFNVRGEPIVCTPEDAYRCFMRTHIDYLVLGPFLLDKTSQPDVEGDRGMADRVPARLTAAQGRRFGLTVGLAFLVLAGIALVAGAHDQRAGARRRWAPLLVLAGLVVPTQLGPVERAWMQLAHADLEGDDADL